MYTKLYRTPIWITILHILHRLEYDSTLDQYSNADDDVTVTVPDFGNTGSVEDLGQGLLPIRAFRTFVDYFVDRGYERGKSIRAAPYDWRLAPGESINVILY